MRLTLHFFVGLRAYLHLVNSFSHSFYSFPILSPSVRLVIFHYQKVPFLPLFLASGTIQLLSALLPVIRLTVSKLFQTDISVFRCLLRSSHFGTIFISFSIIWCLFFWFTSFMINCFWLFSLAKWGC